jgi:carboxymethylenebutenolidase
VTELQRYLAEEVAEDHADGIITRREAMRRLGLLGVSGSAAVAMLGAAAGEAAAKNGGSRARAASDDMKAAVTELKRRERHARIAAIGFCFGGGMIWRLLAAGEARVDAAAPFYGPFPTDGDLGNAKAAVLGVYAGQDDRVNATRSAAGHALQDARLKHRILTFTEAGHAFFNDTGARFDAPAAAEAWRRVIGWFEEYAN